MRRCLRRLGLPALMFAVLFAGCGGSAASVRRLHGPIASTGCPAAAAGNGSMGACAPTDTFKPVPPKLTLRLGAAGGITFSDRSNNDPTTNMAAIRAHGHPALYAKVVQGLGFVDGWFLPQVRSARAAGLAVGGYDFVSTYSTAEAFFFANRLRLAGVTRASARTLPPVLDIEYASASRAGVQAMVNLLHRAYGRVAIYTGAWYWGPHLGCWWPKGAYGWISGYPSAPLPCGMPSSAFVIHQYTDHGFDGAGYADMNLWLGSPAAWRTFSHTATPKRVLERQLRAQLVWRRHLRRVLHAHRCRTAHRHESRPVNCVLTLRRGDASNRRIRSLRNKIKETS